MTANVLKWSKTAANNSTADPDINWAEGQAPSTVNDSARGIMQGIACWRDDTNGTLPTTGSAGSYVIAPTSSIYTTLHNGLRMRFRAGHTNTTTSTFQLDALTAKPLRKGDGRNLLANDLLAGHIYEAQYIAVFDEYRLLSTVPYHPTAAKAWGTFSTNVGGTPTLSEAYNVSSIGGPGGSSEYFVNFTAAMTGNSYCVLAIHRTHVAARLITAGDLLTNSCTLKIYDVGSAAFTTNSVTVSFVVFET